MAFVVGSSALALPQQTRADGQAHVDSFEGKDDKSKPKEAGRKATAAALEEDLWDFLSHQDAAPAIVEGDDQALELAERRSSLRRATGSALLKRASQRKAQQPPSPATDLRLTFTAQSHLPASVSMPKFSLYSRFDPNLLKYLLIRTAQIEEYEFDQHRAQLLAAAAMDTNESVLLATFDTNTSER